MRIGIQFPSFSFCGDPADIGPTFGRLAREADQAVRFASPVSRIPSIELVGWRPDAKIGVTGDQRDGGRADCRGVATEQSDETENPSNELANDVWRAGG